MRKFAIAVAWLLATLAFVAPAMGDQVLGPPAPGHVDLAPAVPKVSAKAHRESGYVHLANCKAALTGANGDNDIQSFLNSRGMTGWGWSQGYPYARYSNTRLAVFFDYYGGSPTRFMGADGGYCMGDDSAIVDKAGDAPAGW